MEILNNVNIRSQIECQLFNVHMNHCLQSIANSVCVYACTQCKQKQSGTVGCISYHNLAFAVICHVVSRDIIFIVRGTYDCFLGTLHLSQFVIVINYLVI